MRTLILILTLLPTVALANPKTSDVPTSMPQVDAARLDAALARLQYFLDKADPFERTVQQICNRYKIDRQALGRTVGVDVETGAIQRASVPKSEEAPPVPKK